MAKQYSHGRTEGYDHEPYGSYKHRDDPNNPLPEHGSHSQHSRQHSRHGAVKRQPRPIVEINKANDAKVGGHGWSSR